MMARGLADWLRAAGLRVEEVAGWQDRGHGELRNDTGNMVVVNHHTAGGPNGRAPSLSTCLYGVPGVPGPLCNVMQTREPDGNDVFMVIAAGVSYNAGTGGYAGVSGNWSTIGLECEHDGVTPYPANRAELSQRFDAAVLLGLGQGNGARSCQHFEWSDTGKIDIGTPKVNADEWRRRVTQFMAGGPPAHADDEGDENTMLIINKQTQAVAIICPPHRPQKIASVNDYYRGAFVFLDNGAWQQYFDDAIKIYNKSIA